MSLLLVGLPFTQSAYAATGLSQTDAQQTSITVSWTAEANDVAYRVFYGEDYSSLQQVGGDLPPTTTSHTISGLKPGTGYHVKIENDYKLSSETLYTKSISGNFKTLPGKVSGVNQQRWYYYIKKMDIGWDKQTGVDEYEYEVKNNKGKVVSKGTTRWNSADVSKISNTVVYTVKVRAISTIMGTKHVGEWSSNAYCFTQPHLGEKGTYARVSKGQLQVKFPKVNGATGYDVMVSTKPTSGYKKVKSLSAKKNSVSVAKVGGKKVSGKKTYYVYVVAKKKVGKTTYTSGKLYYWSTKNSSMGYF